MLWRLMRHLPPPLLVVLLPRLPRRRLLVLPPGMSICGARPLLLGLGLKGWLP